MESARMDFNKESGFKAPMTTIARRISYRIKAFSKRVEIFSKNFTL